MHILNPCEDYTAEKMTNILPILSSLSYQRVIVHTGFCFIHRKLKDDTVYFYCTFDKMRQDLTKGPKVVQILTHIPQQKDYSSRHPRIHKDITFVDGTYTIGWYNMKRNILWLSDLFHYKEEGDIVLKSILQEIK